MLNFLAEVQMVLEKVYILTIILVWQSRARGLFIRSYPMVASTPKSSPHLQRIWFAASWLSATKSQRCLDTATPSVYQFSQVVCLPLSLSYGLIK